MSGLVPPAPKKVKKKENVRNCKNIKREIASVGNAVCIVNDESMCIVL